jgi:hypothetical protein
VSYQLSSEVPAPDGRRGLVVSGSKEIEPGVRAMLLIAERLFRLDVRIRGDSVQTYVRNLSDGELEVHGSVGGLGTISTSSDDANRFAPGRADLGFLIGEGDDRLLVRVTIGTLKFAERGTVRVSAQAVVRQVPPAPAAG